MRVHDGAALVGVVQGERNADSPDSRQCDAAGIAALRLDLEDVGAEVGEKSGDHVGGTGTEIEDPHTGEQWRGVGHSGASSIAGDAVAARDPT